MSTSQTIPAVHKAVSVVEYVAARNEPVTVKELAYTLGIPSASCYRLIRTLVEHNWLREDPAGGLRIAFGLANAARAYSEIEHALSAVEVSLRQLAETLHMSAKISLREGHDSTTALRIDPPRPNVITSPVGVRFHLAVGAASAVLLAALDDHQIERVLKTAPPEAWQRQSVDDVWQRVRECRKRGFCGDFGRYHASIFALATSLQLTDSVVASVSVVGWPDQFEGDQYRFIERELGRSVAVMEETLRARS